MDLFIIIVSLALSARFKQVVVRIRALTKEKVKRRHSKYVEANLLLLKEENVDVWCRVREDYTRLAILCENVDDTISTIMLVSFGNNIFVVLVQLYYSIE